MMTGTLDERIVWQQEPFEQMTSLTDVALSLAVCASGVLVLRGAGAGGAVRRFTGLFLMVSAASLMAGAAYHGIHRTHAAADLRWAIWVATSALSSAGFALLLLAAAAQALVRPIAPLAVVGACAASQTVAFLSLAQNSFLPILLWELGAMAVHLLTNIVLACRSSADARRQSLLLIAGDAVSILSGALQQSTLAIPALHLDHNGLYHVAQIPAALFFYLAFSQPKPKSP
jgi:hypothetical protein